ncbi:MAG TPA: hypothetical protein VF275_07625 [Gammaproteobacteria bacterium]
MLKRMIPLLLGCLGAPAFAGPGGSWLEFDYGRAALETDQFGTAPVNDELSQRLTGQMGGGQGMFMRFDFRRDSLSQNYFENPFTLPDGTEIDVAPISAEKQGQLMSLSIGRTVMVDEGLRLTGELGYGRVEYDFDFPVLTVDAGALQSVAVESVLAEEDTPFLRLALASDIGVFEWAIEGEYMDKVPQPLLLPGTAEVDSELWWNARVGYSITPEWNIGVRYADSEIFSATTLSVRMTL